MTENSNDSIVPGSPEAAVTPGMNGLALLPGDVIGVRTGSRAAALIRLGAAIRGKPDLINHIAVVHHITGGVTWCVEGRPGGAGWVDARKYLASKWTVANSAQPKTMAQREAVCAVIKAVVGTPYDWGAIEADAAEALGLPVLWGKDWGTALSPGHLVCSATASYAYSKAGLAIPGYNSVRDTTPGDWSQFILLRGWETAGGSPL